MRTGRGPRLLALAAQLALAAIAAPLAAQPAPTPAPPRVGLISSPSSGFSDLAVGVWLRALGYREQRNVLILRRYATGGEGQLRGLAAELAGAGPDVIVAPGIAVARAATDATREIPIVMVAERDPVRAGLVASLDRPGGNVTGVSAAIPEAVGRRLALLAEAVPRLARVGIVWNPDSAEAHAEWEEARAAAQALGLALTPLPARDRDDLDAALRLTPGERPGALLVLADPLFVTHAKALAVAAERARLPTMYPGRWFLETYEPGGLLAFGPSSFDVSRRVALYVDRILKGARPADLPVWQLPRFELVVNLRAARALGLTLPPSVLISADKVIE